MNNPFLYFFTSSGHCTSSFGVSIGGTGGYLTAAHCGVGSSSTTVNGQTVSYMTSIQWGVYSDRQVAVAAGASWLVHTGYIDEDMAAVPTAHLPGNVLLLLRGAIGFAEMRIDSRCE